MRKKIVVDTNVLLDSPELLLQDDKDFAISYITLAELDKLKSNPDLSYPARTAIKVIFELFKEDKIEILNVPTKGITNDEKIVNDCKEIGGTLMSQDIGALVVAESRGVSTYDLQNVNKEYDKTFKGYFEFQVDDKFYYRLTQAEYQHIELDARLMELYPTLDVPLNSYIILYPMEIGSQYLCFRKKEDKYILVPQSTKNMRGAGVGIDFLHPEQLVAYDCVFNDDSPLAVITGKVGASKTLMSLVGALSRTCGHKNKKLYDKILVTRPNIPINRQYALGFMKGSLEEKMENWLSGFKSNLQFLYETTQKDRENEEAAKIYNEFFQAMPIESIQGASFHNKMLLVDECYSADTEVLTEQGWIAFPELTPKMKVLEYNSETQSTKFVTPLRHIRKFYEGDMVNLVTENGCDFLVTPKHDMLYEQNGKYKKIESDALKFNSSRFIPVSGISHISEDNIQDNTLSPREKLAIATQADGSIGREKENGGTSLQFSFSKVRKIEAFLDICGSGGFRVTENKPKEKRGNVKLQRRFWVSLDFKMSKDLWETFNLSSLSQTKARAIIEEMVKWDGHINNSNRNNKLPIYLYTSIKKSQCDFYQAVAHLAGYKTKITKVVDTRSETYSDVYRLFINRGTNKVGTQNLNKVYIPYSGDVYCVTVPSGNIMVRRNNKVGIAGNCQLLDINTLRQIMSRVAEGSKLVLILDPSQAYGANRGMEGYKKLLPHCKGNKHISFVELQHIQRSELTKVVDEIFK